MVDSTFRSDSLCNLSELYQKWLEESKSNGIVKVGLTSFALLRPKHCIVAGKSGMHTVCLYRPSKSKSYGKSIKK